MNGFLVPVYVRTEKPEVSTHSVLRDLGTYELGFYSSWAGPGVEADHTQKHTM